MAARSIAIAARRVGASLPTARSATSSIHSTCVRGGALGGRHDLGGAGRWAGVEVGRVSDPVTVTGADFLCGLALTVISLQQPATS
ncbi:hypothetical protein GCM10023148_45790 [Actinokineospora soli]